ncbi:MAG: chitobiase/beta-hexosaminidase C-terminal domain-containing protein [Acetatifactor sp.]|nr:chitobiase/beta-hexosaminidase C-terminal domain-containing protein [Acetatifactor sp.]
MKCPNCGEEMAEGTLYCEHCGEDIHIVPDFEPELEADLEQSISEIMDELDQEHDGLFEEPEPEKRFSPKKLLIRLSVLLCILFLIAAVGAGVWVYLYNSEDYQVSQAMRYTEAGAYDKAVACYNRALELNNDIELRFSLAEVYLLKNNKIEYEYLLREIANDKDATAEQLDRAYGKLIAIYRAREDFQTINDLLLTSDDENLILTYQNYIARAPEFSIREGYYTSIQPLKLTAFGAGKIYYTLDGSEPDENSQQYITPILLEDGDYCVKAVFINDNGIVSDVSVGEYHIENDEIPAPEVSVVSGEYEFPINIEILDEEKEDVYYTTDGSDPTYFSNAYTGPVPMPIGKSVFRFARIVDGVTGEIAERTYLLELNTEYTPAEAVNDIVQYCQDSGKIMDGAGHFDESGDVYQFHYQYVTNINDVSDFYVIAEAYLAADGTLTRTGTVYAVDIYTKEQYRLQRNERGRYELTRLEPEPE